MTVDVRVDGRLPDVVEATGYFAAGEALANVLKHAGARSTSAWTGYPRQEGRGQWEGSPSITPKGHA